MKEGGRNGPHNVCTYEQINNKKKQGIQVIQLKKKSFQKIFCGAGVTF
jgi:hypothetical protein